MADLKISQLGPISEPDVVASDVLALADVSAQQTKRISASDVVKAGARLNADTITFGNDVVVTGDFTVNGTETIINTQTLEVEDKNVVLGNVATPTDITANGGGITLKGTTDKTINWVDSTDSWTSSENVDLANGKSYRINNTEVLNSTTLGSGVVASSLTSVGTIATGIWQGTTVATGYGGTGQTTYTDGQLLIGKTDGTLAKATLTASTGVTITNGDGTITISATGTGVTSVTATSPLASSGGATPDISIQDGTTSQKGAVQLEDSTSSTSTTKAATPNSVKSAYDLANAALPKAGGTMTGALGVITGTASAPGLFISGDTDTGIYGIAANELGIATNGTARITIDNLGEVTIKGGLRANDYAVFEASVYVDSTGILRLPAGTTAERPGTPGTGDVRFNSDLVQFEGYNGTAWGTIGGGAVGGGSDRVFYENDQTVTANYTISTNKNAMTAGPVTINSGITVTVPSGSNWVVV